MFTVLCNMRYIIQRCCHLQYANNAQSGNASVKNNHPRIQLSTIKTFDFILYNLDCKDMIFINFFVHHLIKYVGCPTPSVITCYLTSLNMVEYGVQCCAVDYISV